MKRTSFKAYAILAVLFGALIMSGCSSDYLETESTSSVDSELMFESTDNAYLALTGLLNLFRDPNGSSYGYGGYQIFMLISDLMADDVVFTRENIKWTGFAQLATHRTPTSSDVNYFYFFFNRVAANANNIINNIDEAEGTTSERNYIKGNALTFRAMAYFYLTQCWGKRYIKGQDNSQLGVILNLTNSHESLPRNTVEECYAQINQDLDEAISLLEETEETRENKSYVDQYVAKGLKARVLLAQGNYSEALKYATDVINNSGCTLDADTYSYAKFLETNNRMSDLSSTEWLWGKLGRDDQDGYLRHYHAFNSNTLASYNKNTPRAINNLLYNKIPSTDRRKFIWFPNPASVNFSCTYNGKSVTKDPDGNQPVNQVSTSTSQYRFQYMSNKFLLERLASNRRVGDVPYMRLPEMYLIKAECECRLGTGDAAATLYTLAVTRDAEYVKSTSTGDALLEEIIFQRRIELWGEGFRFFDLKRMNVDLDRGPAPDTSKYPGSDKAWISRKNLTVSNGYNIDPNASNYNMYDTKAIGEANRYRTKDSNSWQWMFPTTETLVNTNCEQNPLGNDGEGS